MAAVSRALVLSCVFGQVSTLHTPLVEDAILSVHTPAYDEASLAEEDESVEEMDFDCNDGFSNWRRGWSGAKMHWCCMNEAKGCPESGADIKARKKAERDMAEANNKSASLAEMKITIKQKVAIVQQKQQAVKSLEDQVAAKNALLEKRQGELEKLYESTAKKDTQRTAKVHETDGKAKAVRMREYGVKMQEEDIVERLKQVEIKTNEINVTATRTDDAKKDIQGQQRKLQASLVEVNKATAEFYSKKNASEAEMRAKFGMYKTRKESTLKKKTETATKNAELKSKVHELKKQEDGLSQQEWEMQDKEQALARKLKRMEEEKEERAALVTVQSNAVKDKEDKVNSQMNLIKEKRKQIESKKLSIRKLTSQLSLLEGRDGSVLLS